MPFPFVSRAHHEAVVKDLRSKLEGCARLLYPDGVPEEFQLLLGIQLEQKASSPAPVPERELTDDEKAIEEMKAEQAADWAEIVRIERTRPSQLGAAMARHMAKWGAARFATPTTGQSPARAVFAKAEAEAHQIAEA